MSIRRVFAHDEVPGGADEIVPGEMQVLEVLPELGGLGEVPVLTDTDVSEEDMEDEEGMEGHRAGGLLASSKECKVVEIGGLKIETYGDYSKCPKCEKNIKSTFIIRHIKLHDQPITTMKCPYQDCSTSFTR